MKVIKDIFFKIVVIIVVASLTSCNSNSQNKSIAEEASTASLNEKKPNILLFFTDDQGTLDAGCYGATDIQTPVLDKLATQGIKFTQAYGHTVCCPSRAALLTGRSPQRSGVNQWTSCHPDDHQGRVMDIKEITIAGTIFLIE